MEKKYKIGEVSNLLGVSPQTLRYYEERSIVSPTKDDQTGYRYYDIWDINYILDTIQLRGFDFSINDITDILKAGDLGGITEIFQRQESSLITQIEKLNTQLQILTIHRQKIQKIETSLNHFLELSCPSVVFHRYRKRNNIQNQEDLSSLSSMKKEMTEWLELIPEIEAAFYIEQPTLYSNQAAGIAYWWGWALSPGKAKQHQIEPIFPNELIPSVPCIYTIFEAGGRNTFTDSFCKQVLIPMQKQGYTVSGNPYGNLLIRTNTEQGMKRYFEIWVPIM